MTDRGRSDESGPVPVRDLLKQLSGQAPREKAAEAGSAEAAATDAEAGPTAVEFEMAGEEWVARLAGAGAYGTGRRGKAKLVAVHFLRATAPEHPVREALIPAAAFGSLRASELRDLFERATPIELDRDRS